MTSFLDSTVLKDLTCGTAAGIAICLSGHSFDTLKVRMQMEETTLLLAISRTFN